MISGVSELLMMKTEQLRRIMSKPRFPSMKENNLEASLALKEDIFEEVQNAHVLTDVEIQGLKATIANKHAELEKKGRSLQIHQTIEKHNSSLLSRLKERREKLEEENREKQLLLRISREQVESSRNIHELIL